MIRGKGIAALARASLFLSLVFSIGVKGTGAGHSCLGHTALRKLPSQEPRCVSRCKSISTNTGGQRLFITQMSLQNPLRPSQVSEERVSDNSRIPFGNRGHAAIHDRKDNSSSCAKHSAPFVAQNSRCGWRGNNGNDCADASPRMRLSHE